MRLMGMQVTMDADQGIRLINLLQPRIAIPVHYNDYGTSGSPLVEFVAAVNEAGLTDRVRYLRHGDTWPLVLDGAQNGEHDGEAAEHAAADQPAAVVARL
jgi:L-ascorbate metabolism protein UlaG (beta-lactamase superfamily)